MIQKKLPEFISIFGIIVSCMNDFLLYNKLTSLPQNLKTEVNDFIDFLTSRSKQISKKNKPVFGSGKGIFIMKPGFNEPLEDFNDYM